MQKHSEKRFMGREAPETPEGLFDRIILAIRQEQELRKTRNLAFGFIALLAVSVLSIPFSTILFFGELENSGLLYFISTAFSGFGGFLSAWQEFSLAIAESLPITGITIFVLNIIIAVFTLRLFLYKKRTLVGYLLQNI